jgi:hypothetical protein
MNAWIPIAAELPIEGSAVITWDLDRGVCLGYWLKRARLKNGRYWAINGPSGRIGTGNEGKPPSHWMPLPEPPLVFPTPALGKLTEGKIEKLARICAQTSSDPLLKLARILEMSRVPKSDAEEISSRVHKFLWNHRSEFSWKITQPSAR